MEGLEPLGFGDVLWAMDPLANFFRRNEGERKATSTLGIAAVGLKYQDREPVLIADPELGDTESAVNLDGVGGVRVTATSIARSGGGSSLEADPLLAADPPTHSPDSR